MSATDSRGGGPANEAPCARLRWKGMFIEAERDDSVPFSGSGSTWCVLTHTCLGPDARPTGFHRCTPSRRCWGTGVEPGEDPS